MNKNFWKAIKSDIKTQYKEKYLENLILQKVVKE